MGESYFKMKKLYVIRREDVFVAIAQGKLNPNSIMKAGTIWCDVAMTDEEKMNYPFPISEA